jgi:outer membrane murein-binding lipoprotein Lpp
MRWNPFSHLAETKKYPEGRMIRSSLRQRFIDSFRVFYGSFIENDLGILNYLLVVPRLSQNLALAIHFNNLLANVAFIFFGAIAFILNAIKFLIAAVLTIAASPLIFLAHCVNRPKINKLSDEIKHLKVKPVKSDQNEKDLKQEPQLDRVLEDQEKDLENVFSSTASMRKLLVKPIYKIDCGNSSFYTLSWHHPVEPSSPTPHDDKRAIPIIALGLFKAHFCGCQGPLDDHPLHGPDQHGPLRAVIEVKPENKNGIKAILKANTFWATEALEEANVLEITENRLELSH